MSSHTNVCIFAVYFASVLLEFVYGKASIVAGSGCGECIIPSSNVHKANVNLYGNFDVDLLSSNAMEAAYSGQCINIPFETLSQIFYSSNKWCLWNPLFGPVSNPFLIEGERLEAQFNCIANFINPPLPSDGKLTNPTIRLVNNNNDLNNPDYLEYGWTFAVETDSDVLIHGRHNYIINSINDEQTCVVNWEKAAGRALENSKDNAKALETALHCNGISLGGGLKCLEFIYHNIDKDLTFNNIEKYCHKYTDFGCNKKVTDTNECQLSSFTIKDIRNVYQAELESKASTSERNNDTTTCDPNGDHDSDTCLANGEAEEEAYETGKNGNNNYNTTQAEILYSMGNDLSVCNWEGPEVSFEKRDRLGRYKYIHNNATKLSQTLNLIKQYKVYNLGRTYTNDQLNHIGRTFKTKLEYGVLGDTFINGAVYSQQGVYSNALGNVGTQFDGIGQIFMIDRDNNENFLFYNNFTKADCIRDYGVNNLGIENMGTVISRAILIDIPGVLNVDRLNSDHLITMENVEQALIKQNLDIDKDIQWGDLLMFHSGWGQLFENGDKKFWQKEPGIAMEVVDFAIERGIVMLGSDAGAFEKIPEIIENMSIPVHQKWITCHGGLIHELMRYDDWLKDARNGKAPWIGAYFFTPVPFKGAVGSPGSPVVIV